MRCAVLVMCLFGGAVALKRSIKADMSDALVSLAAREVRRSLWRLSSGFAGINTERGDDNIVLAVDPSVGHPERYEISATAPDEVSVRAGSPRGVLYGAYRLAELLGVRFSLEGEAFPGRRALDWLQRLPLAQGLAAKLPVTDEPAFESRGLQPFHDFMSGPDGWDVDEYGRVAELIAKGRGNFQGFHTYPLREPLVWVGLEDQFDEATGDVQWSYNTSWATTLESGWGYTPVPTSDYGFGAEAMYSSDCFGNAVNTEAPAICPFPSNMTENNEIFNRAGRMLGKAFRFAKSLGINTTVGTQAPLATPPQPPPAAGSKVPLWLYFSESRGDSFVTTTLCDECLGLYAFHGAVAMVVSQNDSLTSGALPLVTWFNSELTDNWLTTSASVPPAPGYAFVRIEGFAPSSSPTPGTVPLTMDTRGNDHRAVAPPYATANASAEGYKPAGGAGPLAYVWPAPEGLVPPGTEAFYRGTFRRLLALEQPPDQYWVATPESWEWDRVNMSNPLVQTTVQDMLAADAARNAVAPELQLATYGWVLGPLGNRSYLDGVLPADWTMSSIDQLVGWAPVDPAYANVTRHKKLVIPWAEDDPRLTAPELWVNRSIAHGDAAERYNASGLINIHWRTRAVAPQVAATARRAWGGGFTSLDFWSDWTLAAFGPSAASDAAFFFESVDSFSAPMPVSWIDGPGGLKPDADQCQLVKTNYSFVDPFCALRPAVVADAEAGATDADAVERLDYWCSSFLYWRLLAAVECAWSEYEATVDAIASVSDPNERVLAARQDGPPSCAALVGNATEMMARQLESVSTVGERGITTNLRSHSLNKALFDSMERLRRLANLTELPAACVPPASYSGAPRFRVPSPRGILPRGDDLRVAAFALLPPSWGPHQPPTLFWRPHGSGGAFTPLQFSTTARQVFSAVLPSPQEDIEWYAELRPVADHPAQGQAGEPLVFPPSAPETPFVTLLHET